MLCYRLIVPIATNDSIFDLAVNLKTDLSPAIALEVLASIFNTLPGLTQLVPNAA
jgi:hypothetical protein